MSYLSLVFFLCVSARLRGSSSKAISVTEQFNGGKINGFKPNTDMARRGVNNPDAPRGCTYHFCNGFVPLDGNFSVPPGCQKGVWGKRDDPTHIAISGETIAAFLPRSEHCDGLLGKHFTP
jgi:hypothetical protein